MLNSELLKERPQVKMDLVMRQERKIFQPQKPVKIPVQMKRQLSQRQVKKTFQPKIPLKKLLS